MTLWDPFQLYESITLEKCDSEENSKLHQMWTCTGSSDTFFKTPVDVCDPFLLYCNCLCSQQIFLMDHFFISVHWDICLHTWEFPSLCWSISLSHHDLQLLQLHYCFCSPFFTLSLKYLEHTMPGNWIEIVCMITWVQSHYLREKNRVTLYTFKMKAAYMYVRMRDIWKHGDNWGD